MLPRLPDISDGTELKVRELSRRSRRSRDSNESIANLAIRLTNEAKLEPIAEASSTASMAASVMDTVSEALSGIERAMSRRASRESRDSQEERRKNSYDSKSKEGKRRRKSGEFNNEPTIMLDNLSGQRIMLFMQELQAELCDHCKKGNTAMVRAILDKDEALVPQVVELLGERIVDLDAASAAGETPLVKACDSGQLDIVTLLVDRGAATSKCGKDGVTPLHSSAGFGRVDITKASEENL